MEPDGHHYHLNIKKLLNSANEVKIEITKKSKIFGASNPQVAPQTGSLIANFATRTCNGEQNLFAPFNVHQRIVFGDVSTPDCFLWSIPDFGLLKVQQDGSVCFGQEEDSAPLAHDELTFDTPNTLFLASLKVAALKINSKVAQLCQALVADRVHVDGYVKNSGCVKTKQLLGQADFVNEGILELEGTQQKPAILGIKKFQNKNKLSILQAKVHSSNLQITANNKEFTNGSGATFEILHSFFTKSAQINNKGNMICQQANISSSGTAWFNTGNWLMDTVTCVDPLNVVNEGTLTLKNSSLNFGQLKNNSDVEICSGIYTIGTLINKRLRLLDKNWVVTDDPKYQAPFGCQSPDRLLFTNPPKTDSGMNSCLGEIECQRNLVYELEAMPSILRAQAESVICCSYKRVRHINQFKALSTPIYKGSSYCTGRVTGYCDPVSMVNGEFDFPNIGHLELFVNGPLAISSLKAPELSLYVTGPLVVGKDNEHLGIIAATSGPLTVSADEIDGRYAKFYGKGRTQISSIYKDILVGAPISKGPFLYGQNGSYIASDANLIIQAGKELNVRYGQIFSQGKQTHLAKTSVSNVAGTFTSHNDIEIHTPKFFNIRDAIYNQPIPNWTWAYSGCYNQCESSDKAVMGALENIIFNVAEGTNVASSILAGKNILYTSFVSQKPSFGQFAASSQPPTTTRPTSFTSVGRDNYGWGRNDKVGYQRQQSPCSSYSSTILAGQTIEIATGDFVITGNANAPLVSIEANTALFGNTSLSRQTLNPTKPTVVDVTQYMQEQAQRPGVYRLGANGRVTTEFPLGAASVAQQGDLVLLENPGCATPLRWKDIFNPLNSINLDSHLQQLLANLAGKVYAGKAKGNNLSTIFWANANKWRRQNNKEIMSQSDMQNVTKSMLLSQICQNGLSEQQQILLCIAPQDINPYQDQGDIVADEFTCKTEGDQIHLNNRIVTNGPDGITIKSCTGNVNLQTQSHTVVHDMGATKIMQQLAMPQQQLIATAGPVTVKAHRDISRTGTLIKAAGNVNEHAKTGSLLKNPLILQTVVETKSTKSGLFSTSETVKTSLTHHILPSTTISKTKIHDKAAIAIKAVAPQDCAKQEIVYKSPNTNIAGLILANRTTTKTQTNGAFSEQSSIESKETPSTHPATIQTPLLRLVGENARINANIRAQELRDKTKNGAQFVATVAQMLCSGQTLTSSPLMSIDAGYKAGYETMIQPMLMVERIIRTKDTGRMLFESAIIDKNQTEIIGKFVETTYQLKQWQTSWSNKTQLIPDEALVVVALAVALATQGAGVGCLSSLLNSVTAATGMQLSAVGVAMVNAGFSTVCSSLTTSLLKTGDLVGSIEQMTSPCQLKSLAFNMASAGLCSQLGTMLNVNMQPGLKSLAGHVQEQTLHSTVDSLLNIALNKEPVDKALGNTCKQIPLKAAAAYASNKICTSYMDAISAKAAHTAIGGFSGFVQDHSSKGFVSGAVGALTAQTIGDLLVSDAQEISLIAIERLKATQKPLTIETIQQAIEEEVRCKMNYAKIATAGIAALAKQNPSIAMSSAINVLENDIAIRSSLYAMEEFKAMLFGASQTFAVLSGHAQANEQQSEPHNQKTEDESSISENPYDETGRRPFVENPKAGIWLKACSSGELILMKGRGKYLLLGMRLLWDKHDKCPFTVFGHGTPSSVEREVEVEKIHPDLLDKPSLLDRIIKPIIPQPAKITNIPEPSNSISLNAVELAQLIRTAPNYKPGQHIHLFSCECGADPDGIAQQLADEMDVPVSAFTGLAGMLAPVFFSIESELHLAWPKLKEIKTFYPKPKESTESISDYYGYPENHHDWVD